MFFNTNCLRRHVKKAKISTHNFLQLLGMFLSDEQMGPGVSCARTINFFKFSHDHLRPVLQCKNRENPLTTTLTPLLVSPPLNCLAAALERVLSNH